MSTTTDPVNRALEALADLLSEPLVGDEMLNLVKGNERRGFEGERARRWTQATHEGERALRELGILP